MAHCWAVGQFGAGSSYASSGLLIQRCFVGLPLGFEQPSQFGAILDTSDAMLLMAPLARLPWMTKEI